MGVFDLCEAPDGATPEPTELLELNINQLRLIGKSVSRTLDSITKQLERMPQGHSRNEVKRDWLVYDELDVLIRSGLTELVKAS